MNCKLIKDNGIVKIDIDGKIFPPISFKSFRPTDKNISDFYNAGIKLFCVFSTGKNSASGVPYSHFGESWIDDYSYDFSAIDNQMELFIKNAPDAYFNVMLQLDTRDWWLNKYPEYQDSFWYLSQTLADKKWIDCASAYLKSAVSHIEQKYGDKVYAYHIMCGGTTEWLSLKDNNLCSQSKLNEFRVYSDNPNAQMPSVSNTEKPSNVPFLDPKTDKNGIEYIKFHNDLIADSILYFAKIIKDVTFNSKLVGVYFGYVLELGGSALWNNGHISFDKVFSSPFIDIISAPSAYSYPRRLEGGGSFMTTVDSLSLNNKLFYQEEDHRTHLDSLQFELPTPFVGGRDRAQNIQQSIDMMRREFMLTQTKQLGLWYFDMFEGWYYDPLLMNEVKTYTDILNKFSKTYMHSVSEVAVFVDAESLFYTNKNSLLDGELFTWGRLEFSKSGAPFDIYSTQSIYDLDLSQYKVVVFLNLFKKDEKLEQFINLNVKKDNRTVIWNYAPFYIDNDCSLDNISKITDMEVGILQPNENIIVCGQDRYGFSYHRDKSFYVKLKKDSYFFCEDQGVDVLGRYQLSLMPALVRKKLDNYTSVYNCGGMLTADVLRKIFIDAGVFVYSDNSDNFVYVNNVFVGVYHASGKDALINVKVNGTFMDLFTGAKFKAENNKIFLKFNGTNRSQMLIKIS